MTMSSADDKDRKSLEISEKILKAANNILSKCDDVIRFVFIFNMAFVLFR